MPPPTTNRQTPAGRQLDDGLSTKIAFALDPDISFWERTVKPPGIDGGDAHEVSTMFNTKWRTRAPRILRTMTDIVVKAFYDPAVYSQIEAIVNVEGGVTTTFPNGDKADYYGFLRMFDPDEASEAAAPECTITITPTNRDPVTGIETDPVFTGTTSAPMYSPAALHTLPVAQLEELAEKHRIEDFEDMDRDNLIYALARLTIPVDFNESVLRQKSVRVLRAMAEEHGVEIPSGAKRDDIIQALATSAAEWDPEGPESTHRRRGRGKAKEEKPPAE